MERACRIRAGRTADIDAIVEIEAVSFSDPWSPRMFRAHLGELFLVAEEDATPVGYLVGMVVGPEAEILNVAVAPERRGQGIGRALVTAALGELGTRDVRTVYLEVRISNAAAQRLYAGNGFREMGRRRGYYDHPREDAMVMRCDLGPRVEPA
jgi:ribosomal-protein-alanine N-acetyltransferase